MAISTSSSAPSLMNSGLPARNSSAPSRLSSSLYPISIYSSAGTTTRATRPESSSMSPGAMSPIATAINAPIWQWWPQACAAPVSGSA